MKDIFNHTLSYDYNWVNQIKKYDYNRTHLAWEKNPVQEKITTKMVKQNDLYFNPILQKYSNREYDRSLREKENKKIIESIIKNQDNQLQVEQTFDVINLQDRLKGFEKHPNYPVKKDLINKRKNINHDTKDYNILSNLPLSEHHYDKPENRPKNNKSPFNRIQKYSYKFGQERDYDIISTRYKKFNEEKTDLDKEFNKIATAKIFYKNNDYNPIKGAFFNEEKEKDFQEKRKEEQKNWGKEKAKNMPKCAKGRSDVYNLISLKVVDPKEFNKILKQEKDKKKRFEIREKMEKYYREQNLASQDREENKVNGKDSYYKYKEQDKRQYDIIDLKDRSFKELQKKMRKPKYEGWDKILNGAGENNTFQSKSLYKDPYDYSDSGLYYDKFKMNRNKTLSSLPKIEADKLFIRKKKISKCGSHSELLKAQFDKKILFNKEKFFREPPKNLNMIGTKYDNITGNKDCTGKEDEFKSNKEKNLRNVTKNIVFDTSNEKKNK